MPKRLSVVVLHYEIDESDKIRLQKTIDSFNGEYDELIIADKKTDHLIKKVNEALRQATGDYIIMCGNDNEKISGNLRDLCQENTVTTAMVDPHKDVVLMTMTCIPKNVLEQVNYFDELYQCYCADEDFILKLREKNIPIKCHNDTVISHSFGGRTTSRLNGYDKIAISDQDKFKTKWSK